MDEAGAEEIFIPFCDYALNSLSSLGRVFFMGEMALDIFSGLDLSIRGLSIGRGK